MEAFTKQFPDNFCYCPSIWAKAKQLGIAKLTGQPGDLVMFDWQKDGVCDHIGMVICNNNNGTYTTIEGNTSNVSNGNGNCVQIRTRETSCIKGFVRPPYESTMDKLKAIIKKKKIKKGYTGSLPTLQDHKDGKYIYTGDMKEKVKKLQKFLNWELNMVLS